jgi:hypothetical protein
MAMKYTVGEIGRRINDVAVEGLTGERPAAETISFLAHCVDELIAGRFPDLDQFPALLGEELAAAA